MWRKLEEELMIQCGEDLRKMLKNCETSLALTWYSMQDFKLMDPIDIYLWARKYMFVHWFKRKYGKGFYKEEEKVFENEC